MLLKRVVLKRIVICFLLRLGSDVCPRIFIYYSKLARWYVIGGDRIKAESHFGAALFGRINLQFSPQARSALSHDGQAVVAFWLFKGRDPDAIIGNPDDILLIFVAVTAYGNVLRIRMFNRIQYRFAHNLQYMYLLLGIQRL